MAKRMLIDATHPEETRVVVLNGNRLEEFDFETSTKKQIKGNIYLAKVTRVEPSLQAAFVDFGGNRHGFLAFSEIHPDYYRIPVGDREREENEAHERDRDERDGERHRDRERGGRRRHGRSRAERTRGGDRVSGPAASETRETPGQPYAGQSHPEAQPSAEDHHSPAAIHPGAEGASHRDEHEIAPSGESFGHDRDHHHDDFHHHHDTEHAEHAPESTGEQHFEPWTTSEGAAAEHDRFAAEPESPAAEATHETHGDAFAAPAGSGEAAPEHGEPSAPRGDHGYGEERSAPEPGTALAVIEGGGETVAANGHDSVEALAPEPSDPEREAAAESIETFGGDEFEEQARQRSRSMRHYKIQEVIKRRQIMLVQVTKEERGTKGAALTTYLSLAGRYCVLMPNTGRGGGVSRKITSAQDRKRLKDLVGDLEVPEGMGVIVRTAGSERSKAEIKRDYDYLIRLWDEIRDLTLKSTAPALIYEEGNLIKRSIRDLYSRDIEEVLVEGEEGYRTAKAFMKMLMPSHAKRVQPYRDPVIPLLHRFQIESQIDAIHSPVVQLKSGGYIVINPTEALVAIDVNSGRSTKERNIEETALRTNLEAAEEVARQLRLRDLAGLIVIDFIDMEEHRNQNAVERKLKEAMKHDRARIQVGRISPFGLLELSRQRLRPSLLEASSQPCPHCNGSGSIRSTESTALHVLRAIEEEGIRRRSAEISVAVPTTIALYILNQKRQALAQIEHKYGFHVLIARDDTLVPPAFRLDRLRPFSPEELAQPLPALTQIADIASDADDLDDEVEDEEEREAEAAAPGEAAAGPAEAGGDSRGDEERRGRRRRRRRRRGDQSGDARGEPGLEAHGAEARLLQEVAAEDADQPGGDDGERADAPGEAGSTAEPRAEGGDDEERRRRRRGRRGGRRRRREGGDTDAPLAAAGEGYEPAAEHIELMDPGPAAPASAAEEIETAMRESPLDPAGDLIGAEAVPVAEVLAPGEMDTLPIQPRHETAAPTAAETVEALASPPPAAEPQPEPAPKQEAAKQENAAAPQPILVTGPPESPKRGWWRRA
jgi:ribonuclease E